jgi:transposase InsO family protein
VASNTPARFIESLAQVGVIPSMSRKGNCYDNANMESFWSTHKCGLFHHHFTTRVEAKVAL